jgi:predicted nucleotidyltransferase
LESRKIPKNWSNIELVKPIPIETQAETKHVHVLKKLLKEVKRDQNTLGYLVFGSVAAGTFNEKSDLDVITILKSSKPSSGIKKILVDDLVVDSLFMTEAVLIKSVNTVPYLLHTLTGAKLLFDREGSIKPLIENIRYYFRENTGIDNEWKNYIKQSNEIKSKTGCRASSHGKTIIDVWNEIERRYSNGRIKRPFFNAFYFTNSFIFSLVKRFFEITKGGGR